MPERTTAYRRGNARSHCAPRAGAWAAALFAAHTAAAEPPPPDEQTNEPVEARTEPEPPPAASLDAHADLLFFQDIPVVVSAGRRAQPINQASAPVSVLTADDIHYSGLTSIPEILPFVPGMDVIRVDRNRYAIGVRGLSDVYSSRSLTLLDGRIAENPIFGGVEFQRLPVLMEDIERIEVVRGPAGAAWGANAGSGLINIITRKPGDGPASSLLTSTINEFGDTYTHLRWEDSAGDLSWRTSVGYEGQKSSERAISGDDFQSDDWRRALRFDTQFVSRLSPDAQLHFGLAGSMIDEGSFEFLGTAPVGNVRYDMLRAFVRIEQSIDESATLTTQWYATHWWSDSPTVQTSRALENVFTAQLDFDIDRHALSVGADLRFSMISVDRRSPTDVVFSESVTHEHWMGLFMSDRWRATERLTFEAQIRTDWYSETHADWSGRLTALRSLDDQNKHVLRLSAARAFRAPLLVPRDLWFQTLEVAPGVFVFSGVPAEDLQNEQVWSLEAGYTGPLSDRLTLRADAYYQRMADLIGYETTVTDLGFVQLFEFQAQNIAGAHAWGGELELALELERARLTAWYAYNDFEPDQTDQNVRGYHPAPHKVGVTARGKLTDTLTGAANYRWTDRTPSESAAGQGVPASHRLDLTLSADVFDRRGEIMLGVTDLFDETSLNIFSLSDFTSHETPGRAVFVRFQLRF